VRPKGKVTAAVGAYTVGNSSSVILLEVFKYNTVKERFAVEDRLFTNNIESSSEFFRELLSICGSCEHSHSDVG
jgi:hypothetical protein